MSADVEYIERIQKRIGEIMYKNRKLFSVIDNAFIAAEYHKVPKKDVEFFVRQTAEFRIGLYYIISSNLK